MPPSCTYSPLAHDALHFLGGGGNKTKDEIIVLLKQLHPASNDHVVRQAVRRAGARIAEGRPIPEAPAMMGPPPTPVGVPIPPVPADLEPGGGVVPALVGFPIAPAPADRALGGDAASAHAPAGLPIPPASGCMAPFGFVAGAEDAHVSHSQGPGSASSAQVAKTTGPTPPPAKTPGYAPASYRQLRAAALELLKGKDLTQVTIVKLREELARVWGCDPRTLANDEVRTTLLAKLLAAYAEEKKEEAFYDEWAFELDRHQRKRRRR